MAKVRSLPRNPWYAIVPGDRGATLTAARVFAHVVGLASQRVPGVSLAVGSGRSPAGADIGVAGRHVVVDVQVVVQLGAHIPTLVRLLRGRIREHVVSMTGIAPAEINVHVIDVAD
jgi:uncharacterized alkaline shock family protein YloU